MTLTRTEKDRIKAIRKAVQKFKRKGVDVSTWEAPFLIGILDRFIRTRA